MSKPFTNPFFEADMSKLFSLPNMSSEMRMPEFSPDAMMTMQRKNIEACTALGQAMFDTYKSLWQRQADLCRQMMEETTQSASAIMSCPTPEEKIVRQAETSKVAIEKCLANMRDIAETVAKCNSQAVDTVSSRVSESIDELRSLIKNNQAA